MTGDNPAPKTPLIDHSAFTRCPGSGRPLTPAPGGDGGFSPAAILSTGRATPGFPSDLSAFPHCNLSNQGRWTRRLPHSVACHRDAVQLPGAGSTGIFRSQLPRQILVPYRRTNYSGQRPTHLALQPFLLRVSTDCFQQLVRDVVDIGFTDLPGTSLPTACSGMRLRIPQTGFLNTKLRLPPAGRPRSTASYAALGYG